ncbi:protein of unknown function [Paraburkholderia kururiensis]
MWSAFDHWLDRLRCLDHASNLRATVRRLGSNRSGLDGKFMRMTLVSDGRDHDKLSVDEASDSAASRA